MLFPIGIRNRVAILTKGVTIAALLSSANSFCYSNALSSARLSTSKGKDKIDYKCFAMRCETGYGVNNNDTVLEAMNKKSTEFVHVLDNETTAWHMGGSSDKRAERRNDKDGRIMTKFSSHKDQWMKETFSEWPSQCSIEDCSSVPTVGAHVVIDGKENVHLVPLCSRCNSDFSKNWLPDIKESGEIQPRNGFQLETGTPCLELNHISREECLVSYNRFSWIEMYDRLVLHIEKYNTTSISYRDKQLGEWATYQRFRYNKTLRTITSKEINLLEDIGFSWDPDGDSWNKKFALLKQYKHKNGNCNVSQQHEDNEQNLGQWLVTQRQNRKNNRLDAEKEKQLEDLGVIWEPLIDQWEENYKLLQHYKDINGNCNIPVQYKVKDVNLGWWLDTQRKGKKNFRINAEKGKRLNDLGVIWEPSINQWEEKYELLQQFKNERGHCNVSTGQKEDEKYRALGKWLANQRSYYRKGNLRNERLMKLDKLGVVWNLRKRKE